MRARRLRYAPAALDDISEIHAYLVAQADAVVADRVIARIRTDVRRRREMPLVGAPRPDYGENCRMLISGSYAVYYSFAEGEMTVLRILHAARDRDAIMRASRKRRPPFRLRRKLLG